MARHEIHMENYCKIIHIEAQTLVDMVQHQILNAASQYTKSLCDTILAKKQALPASPAAWRKPWPSPSAT